VKNRHTGDRQITSRSDQDKKI